MELVPGKTLDELIPRAGMRLGEALKHAIQMASALKVAHEAEIVHRAIAGSRLRMTPNSP